MAASLDGDANDRSRCVCGSGGACFDGLYQFPNFFNGIKGRGVVSDLTPVVVRATAIVTVVVVVVSMSATTASPSTMILSSSSPSSVVAMMMVIVGTLLPVTPSAVPTSAPSPSVEMLRKSSLRPSSCESDALITGRRRRRRRHPCRKRLVLRSSRGFLSEC